MQQGAEPLLRERLLLFWGAPMKTYVYVDAFNLYFGCVKGTPYKWLDLALWHPVATAPDRANQILYRPRQILAEQP